ncbi:MAG: HAD family hydrolase [Clostridiaceae bacterium]|nr:HAD family hydrolase [Clostridiaceae bacterium]
MDKLVIWDFNGTIIDDVELCRTIINRMLRRRDLPQLTLADYQSVFDFPVRTYYQQVGFDMDREPFPCLAAEYMDQYQPASFTCPLRKNVVDVLAFLAGQGYRQVLLSATKRDFLIRQLEHYDLIRYFDPILGLDDIYGRSKSEMAADWFHKTDLDPEKVVLIGDTVHDQIVAQALRCRAVLLAGGHNSRERLAATGSLVVNQPDALLADPWFL